MIASRRVPSSASRQYVRTIQTVSTSASCYGRTAAYRRIGQIATFPAPVLNTSSQHTHLAATFLLPSINRSLHISRTLQQQAQPKPDPAPSEDVNDRPRSQESDKSDANAEGPKSDEPKSDEPKSEKDGEEKKDKKDAPPPPPHGDKTPWQVFRETWSTELKASKEWNESTKQLAGEVQDFRESERVKKASAAYDKTFGAVGRGAQGAAQVAGKGAALAWETPVLQGIRKGVNATGRGIEQATRPVRETETFKSVSEAIDDGSSTRYGGWMEKEERRRLRAARDAKDPMRKMQNIEEDVK